MLGCTALVAIAATAASAPAALSEGHSGAKCTSIAELPVQMLRPRCQLPTNYNSSPPFVQQHTFNSTFRVFAPS